VVPPLGFAFIVTDCPASIVGVAGVTLPDKSTGLIVTVDNPVTVEAKLSVTLTQYVVVAVGDVVYALDVAPLIDAVHAELEYH
jgi:hypothetical protein